MSFLKKLFITLFVLIVVVIGAVVIFVSTFDANQYKEQITSAVKKQTGRDLTINGDLELTVYPDIAIALGKVSLSNATGFSDKDFAKIESAKVSVKLLPLLKKQLQADRIFLDSLKLNLHRKADGTTNWDDLAKSGSKKKSSEAKEDIPVAKEVQETINNLSIAGVVVKNTEVHWRDDQAKQDITLTSLNLETGTIKKGSPLPVDLSVVLKQKKPAMNVALEAKTTVTLGNDSKSFSLADLKLHTKITGAQIPKGELDLNLAGDIKGNTDKVSVPNLSLQANLTGDLIPEGTVKADINGNVNFDMKGQLLSITGLKLDSTVNGKPLAGGDLKTLLTGDTKLNLKSMKLAIPNLAIVAKLAGGHVKGGAATVKVNSNTQFDLNKQYLTLTGLKVDAVASGDMLKGGKANSQIAGDIQVDLKNTKVKSPKITINSDVDGGLVPGGKLIQQANGNIDLNWSKNTGAVNLSSLFVKLADLELKGSKVKLLPLGAKPGVSGQFQTNTFNLKKVLKSLEVELPTTNNPKAFSQVQAQFSLKADTENANLNNLKLKLDKSTLTGNAIVNNFAAPSIKTQLTIDKINADDYLAPASAGEKAAVSTQQAPSTSNASLLPLEVLRTLNIDGKFKIGSMVINKLKLEQINANVKAKNGLVVIDPANASLYKGKYKGRITLDAKQATPTMKMHHELVGLRSEGLLFDLFADKYISGGTKVVTDLSSRGNTIEALLKNLNGTSSVAFKNGSIRDSSLAEKVSLVVQAFEKKEIKDGKSVVKFTGLSGDWKTTNGVFATKNLSLDSPYFKVDGVGTADIANNKLDITLNIGPKQKKGDKKLSAPIRIHGSFDDLKYSLDMKGMLKALAQADLDKVKADAKEKLKEAEVAAKAKLKLAETKAKERLQSQLKAKEARLKKKLGDDLAAKLKAKAKTSSGAKGKDAEGQVKDKLKNKLKSLF